METNKAIEAIHNLYGLLMEMNYHRTPEDYIDELDQEDAFISKHLQKAMLYRAQAKALLKKKQQLSFIEAFNRFKEQGLEKIQALLTSQERTELIPLFRKFEELSKADQLDIYEDQDFLAFISTLKDKLEDHDEAD
jgi:tRNA splicing endonuclease